MPPVQGKTIDDAIAMSPNNSDSLMERKLGANDRLANGHISPSEAHAMDITPWPSGIPTQTLGFVSVLKKVSVFLLSIFLILMLLLLSRDSAKLQLTTSFVSKDFKTPVGCYLKTVDRQGRFALMEEEERDKRGCERRFPQALIAGTKKGGTTTLKYFLSYHPDVVMATKEMKFFNSNYKKGMNWYKENMPYSTETQITIEKTPGYFVGHQIPNKINTLLPGTKIIIIMRDPVKRAISDFVHMSSKINCIEQDQNSKRCAKVQEQFYKSSATTHEINVTSSAGQKKVVAKSREAHDGYHYEVYKSFKESVLFPNGSVNTNNLLIDKGIYIRHLQYWFNDFSPERLLLIDGEKFVTDPAPTLRIIERFLGVRHYFTDAHFYFDEEKHFFCLNKPFRNCMSDGKGRDHPDVSEDVLRKLKKFYAPYNRQLSQYLNTSLRWGS